MRVIVVTTFLSAAHTYYILDSMATPLEARQNPCEIRVKVNSLELETRPHIRPPSLKHHVVTFIPVIAHKGSKQVGQQSMQCVGNGHVVARNAESSMES
jgi:hypothetical protein